MKDRRAGESTDELWVWMEGREMRNNRSKLEVEGTDGSDRCRRRRVVIVGRRRRMERYLTGAATAAGSNGTVGLREALGARSTCRGKICGCNKWWSSEVISLGFWWLGGS